MSLTRPNTFRPDLETIEVIGGPIASGEDWYARRQWVMPWVRDSMCGLLRAQQETGCSIGMFKPLRVLDVTQVSESPEWSNADLAKLWQGDLFLTKEKKVLEKIPYRWRYKYVCAGPGCIGHEQTIVDWELAALYLNLTKKGITDPAVIHDAVRRKFLIEMCGSSKDVFFFTGNMGAHPGSFLILGVFWPPIDLQGSLF